MTTTELRGLIISSPEVCEELNVSPPTLDYYKRRGWLQPLTDGKSGRAYAYFREDVENFKAKLEEIERYRPKGGPARTAHGSGLGKREEGTPPYECVS